MCPHVYIVQVFDNTPAAIDHTLESGDRIVAVNSVDVSGRTKLEVARMIQNAGVSKLVWPISPQKVPLLTVCGAQIVLGIALMSCRKSWQQYILRKKSLESK